MCISVVLHLRPRLFIRSLAFIFLNIPGSMWGQHLDWDLDWDTCDSDLGTLNLRQSIENLTTSIYVISHALTHRLV